ncbi:DUF3667 domain-containing protein [Flavihumibacter profundi]|uniref:DUF3667 domain-containing protein n=1 Tax=Flavihumibacter profundi TaxID=2716883 RepID=UPI001CC53DD9|nr:DUF3667 domain-containing protein [Flavihumibacter profundi]MBZ5857623.1 DUF3667 domain-containing protein [Flavihumibacter profundi]
MLTADNKTNNLEGDMMICKNCGHSFQLNYCNACGQSAGTHRITWRLLLEHLPHAIFHVDHGLFFSLLELIKRPGHSIREYLEGKRKGHVNPFTMLVLTGGLCSYLYVHFNFRTVLASVNLHELEEQSAMVAHKYFALRTIFFCMLCSIGDYLVFREKKYNLPEMVIANVYMFCGVSMIQLMFIPLLLIARNLNLYAYAVFFIIPPVLAYLVYTRFQFLQAFQNKKLQVKIILAVVLYAVIVVLIGQQIVRPFLGN